MAEKGQIAGLDLIAGLSISLLILSFYIILWDSYSWRYQELSGKDSRDSSALAISDALVNSPGYPANWSLNPMNATMIGFAQSQNVLDPDKVNSFFNLSYADAKTLLGIQQDFFMDIRTPDGYGYAAMGAEPGNSTAVSEIIRIALLNNQAVWIRVRLYG